MYYKEWKTEGLWAALARVMKKDISEEVVAHLISIWLQKTQTKTIIKKQKGLLVQDGRVEGCAVIIPVTAPKLKLAVEQPSTGECWNPPKKKKYPTSNNKEEPAVRWQEGRNHDKIKFHTCRVGDP